MTQQAPAQAWLQEGTADGAVRPVEYEPDGRPPALLMLRGGDLYVGGSDQPEQGMYATYELLPEPPGAGLWLYRHVGTLTA